MLMLLFTHPLNGLRYRHSVKQTLTYSMVSDADTALNNLSLTPPDRYDDCSARPNVSWSNGDSWFF